MRKLVRLFGPPVLVATALGCGWFGSNPGKSVGKYLGALAKEKYEAAYALASSRDRAAKTLEAFAVESAAVNPMKNAAGRSSFEIRGVTIEGDRATVEVTVTPAGGSPSPQSFKVVKEADGWRLFLGWEAQALLAEGRKLRQEGRLPEALEKYQKAFELDPANTEASDGVAALERASRLVKLKQEYMETNLEIIGFKATPGRGRGGMGTTVSGRLLNNGHRTLTQVEVTVYFLDDDSRIVAEKTYRPIPSADIVFYGEGGSLKRGLTRDFGYVVDEPLPKEWAGKARARVTNVEFEEGT
jgi:tetratricopeptide (TPR) repeat protein